MISKHLRFLAFLSTIPIRQTRPAKNPLCLRNRLTARRAIIPNACNARMHITARPSSVLPQEAKADNESNQETLIKLIKEKGAQKSVRRIVKIVEESEAGESEWANTGMRPGSTVYNTAIRVLIRAKRPDLAQGLFQLRRKAQTTRPEEIKSDPNLAAAIIRSALRDSKKRNDRAMVSETLFNNLKDDCDYVFTNASDTALIERDVPRLASAFANLVSAFLDALHRGTPVKTVDKRLGMEALSYLRKLSNTYDKLAALSVNDYNELIRTIGKLRSLEKVFDIVDLMRTCKVQKNNVTFEYIANAAVRQVRFITGAVSMETLPEPLAAEVAFVGRSNVGKSSLVNMVCNRKALAYVSGRPGKTQQFNYFLVNENDPNSQFYIVDLPGVGYAKVPKQIQMEWMFFMQQYFQNRVSLRLVFHLIDGRHGPMADDQLVMAEMGAIRGAFVYVIVLTKMDKTAKQKAKQSVLDSTRAALQKNGCADDLPIVLTSAESKLGRDEMWRHLQAALKPMTATKELN